MILLRTEDILNKYSLDIIKMPEPLRISVFNLFRLALEENQDDKYQKMLLDADSNIYENIISFLAENKSTIEQYVLFKGSSIYYTVFDLFTFIFADSSNYGNEMLMHSNDIQWSLNVKSLFMMNNNEIDISRKNPPVSFNFNTKESAITVQYDVKMILNGNSSETLHNFITILISHKNNSAAFSGSQNDFSIHGIVDFKNQRFYPYRIDYNAYSFSGSYSIEIPEKSESLHDKKALIDSYNSWKYINFRQNVINLAVFNEIRKLSFSVELPDKCIVAKNPKILNLLKLNLALEYFNKKKHE